MALGSSRNSISTAEAIRQFIAENPAEAGHNPNLEVFRRSVYKQILNSSSATSGSSGRDDRLFSEFKTIWRTFLLPSEMKEKLYAYSAVFGSSRKNGNSILSSMELFRQNVTKLCELLDGHGDEGVHEIIPIPLFNLVLIRFLNLNDSSLAEFRRRLQDHLSQNEGHLASLQFMRNIDVDDMVSLEKRSNPRRNFMTEECNSGYGDETKQGIEVLPDGFGNFASSGGLGTGAAVMRSCT